MNSPKDNNSSELKDIIILIIMLFIFCMLSWYETHYEREATVYSIENNTVTVIDDYGNYWEFESEGFNKGDRIKMLMDTMRTDSDIHDDKIQKVIIINK